MIDGARRFNAAAMLLCAIVGFALLGALDGLGLAVGSAMSVISGAQQWERGRTTDGALQVAVGAMCGAIGILPVLLGFFGLGLAFLVANAAMRGEGSPRLATPAMVVTILGFFVAQLLMLQCILLPAVALLSIFLVFSVRYGRLTDP